MTFDAADGRSPGLPRRHGSSHPDRAASRRDVHGLVGVGSFDDTGAFDDLKLRGKLR
ncbi:MAG: hypothetical protein M0C28_00465 [Candidatus Moduliflexus flocculans]|nr:hypothetical protein [Candidatus Moduliflexus flocculans]